MPSDPSPPAAATMRDHVASAHERLRQPGPMPQQLTAAAAAIAAAHHAIAELINLGDPALFAAYMTARYHAAEAGTALRTAPSLSGNHSPAAAGPPVNAPVDSEYETATAVAALAQALTRELVQIAEAASGPSDIASADASACLTASLHASRLHEALR